MFILNPYRYVEADPYFANVVSLLHFNGANGGTTFTDVKGKTWTAANQAQIDTAQFKFGSSSLTVDGVGDYIQANDADFVFGTGDFTVEMFFRQGGGAGMLLVDTRVSGNTTPAYALYDNDSSGINNLTFFAANADRIVGSSFSSSVWYHVAISRVSGQTRLFRDGVQQGSAYTDANNYNSTQFRLGHNYTATSSTTAGFNGWIDELRITKGVGRYTANFTPPSAAFPNS